MVTLNIQVYHLLVKRRKKFLRLCGLLFGVHKPSSDIAELLLNLFNLPLKNDELLVKLTYFPLGHFPALLHCRILGFLQGRPVGNSDVLKPILSSFQRRDASSAGLSKTPSWTMS